MAQEETLVRNYCAALPTTQACLEVSFKFNALPNQQLSQSLIQVVSEFKLEVTSSYATRLEITSSYCRSLISSSMLPTMFPRHGRAGVISKPAWL